MGKMTIDAVPQSLIYKYNSVMAGHETFGYSYGDKMMCRLDTNGSNRNFDPSGAFPDLFKVEIVNVGAEIITFDSGGIASTVGAGLLGLFYYSVSAGGWIG